MSRYQGLAIIVFLLWVVPVILIVAHPGLAHEKKIEIIGTPVSFLKLAVLAWGNVIAFAVRGTPALEPLVAIFEFFLIY